MKLRLAVSLLSIALAPMLLAKTKMLVEDPDNVVVGRYAITASQRVEAQHAADYLRMDDYVVMYIGSWAGEGKESLQK